MEILISKESSHFPHSPQETLQLKKVLFGKYWWKCANQDYPVKYRQLHLADKIASYIQTDWWMWLKFELKIPGVIFLWAKYKINSEKSDHVSLSDLFHSPLTAIYESPPAPARDPKFKGIESDLQNVRLKNEILMWYVRTSQTIQAYILYFVKKHSKKGWFLIRVMIFFTSTHSHLHDECIHMHVTLLLFTQTSYVFQFIQIDLSHVLFSSFFLRCLVFKRRRKHKLYFFQKITCYPFEL